MINATWLSRRLRAAGVNISPSRNVWVREGVYIRNQGLDRISIKVDIDTESLRSQHVDDITTELGNLGIPYKVNETGRLITVIPSEVEKVKTEPAKVLNIKGKFADWLEGSGVLQGEGDYEQSRKIREAWKKADVIHRGRSYTVQVTVPDSDVAEWFEFMADTFLGLDESSRAERDGAKDTLEQAAKLRKQLAEAELKAQKASMSANASGYSYAHQSCRECVQAGSQARETALRYGATEGEWSIGEHKGTWKA